MPDVSQYLGVWEDPVLDDCVSASELDMKKTVSAPQCGDGLITLVILFHEMSGSIGKFESMSKVFDM